MKSLKMLGIVSVMAITAGCTPEWARENETNLLMTVSEIAGFAGGEGDGQEANILLSDVSDTFNDDARISITVIRKNPTVNNTSPLEGVRLESYQVQYFRSDGRNVEGVDVPFRITGSLSSTLILPPVADGFSTADVFVTLVRHQAKQEPPLRNLIGIFLLPASSGNLIFPSEGIVTTTAEVTIYGRQITTGEVLRAFGRMQVTFADFADDEA